ncbi:MAG: type VI secretion system-associated protein TagF [Deltaproteobacteria bacterium]|nr:type VI secretion system-associated protein TagF [Deltaproteobacteria bacterium]
MFWRRKKAEPPLVYCYGKLPATGDFVRLNATTEAQAAFDTWLQSGVNFARETMGEAFEPAFQKGVGLFIYRPDGEPPGRGLVGVWAASRDSAGRRYPMVVGAAYDYAELVAVGPALPIATWGFLRSAYELLATAARLQPDEFVARVAQIQPPPLDDAASASAAYRQWLDNHGARALWETGFGSVEARFWVVHAVAASVEPFRGQELPAASLGIRFPLGSGDAYAAAVWLELATRLGRWQRTLLSAFWAPQGSMVLHMGPPHVATFRALLLPGGEADHITDLCAPAGVDPATARQRLGPELGAAVDATDVSLAAFLQKLG